MTSRTGHHPHAGPVLRALRGLASLLGRLLRGSVALVGLGALLGGVPWLLVHFIGWPLPDHWPDLEEISSWLLRAPTTDMVLDVLAIAAWIIWVLFVVDVLRGAVEAAHGIRWPDVELPDGPLRSTAALLIGWLLLALLGNRTPTPATAAPPSLDWAVSPVVATAPQHPGTAHRADPEGVVRAPQDGVHDSLWRIAQRDLGDGNRWSEIWQLNKHRVQNDGRMFTDPQLIQPGWRLALPATAEQIEPPDRPASNAPGPAVQPEVEPDEGGSERPDQPEVTETPGAAPAPNDHAEQAEPTRDGPGIDLGDGVFLSLTVAAAISAALLVARRRFRRFWVPGRSSHDPMPVAPTVYELRLAHLAATQPDSEDDTEVDEVDAERAASTRGAPAATSGQAEAVPMGVRDGLPVATRVARRGLGLVGPGTDAAARAILVTLLTSGTTQVVVAFDDLPRLVGEDPDRLPTALRVVPDIESALALLDPTTSTDGEVIRRVLVASPPQTTHESARLGAVLAPGASTTAAILLGQHRPGATVYVDDDGTVAATNPGPAETLRGTRLFTATTTATADLLDLLAAADPHLPPRVPADREADPQLGEAPVAVHGPASEPDLVADPAEHTPTRRRTAQPIPPADRAATDEILAPVESPHSGQANVDPPAPETVEPRLHLRVLGRFTATVTAEDADEIPVRLGQKVHELLTYLALHRSGVSRDTLVHDLWPHAARGSRPTNNLNRTLRRLRDAVEAAGVDDPSQVVRAIDGRLRLNPDAVMVDFWECDDARAAARNATTDDQRRNAYQRMVAAYGGQLGADLADAEWAHGPAYATQCAVVDALGRLAAHAEPTDPKRALDLMEAARGYDPTNETLYATILRLQAHLGYHDAIERTLSLLASELAAHKDRPSPEIDGLVRSLRRRYTTETATRTNGSAAQRNGRQSDDESATNARTGPIRGVE